MRQSIDALDREIIGPIGVRAAYVERDDRFETGGGGVPGPERQKSLLEARCRWAEKNRPTQT